MTHADVPSTDDVRDVWVDYHLNPLPRAEGIALVPEYQAAFDAWLETVHADKREMSAENREMFDAMWRGAHEQYRRELREQMAALRDSLYREASATWNPDDAATLGSRGDGVELAMDLIEGGSK